MSEDAGKGDDPRKVNKRIWDENFKNIFKDNREPSDFQKDKKGDIDEQPIYRV